MNRNHKFVLVSISLSVATALAFVGVTTGSLAWYAYSRSVGVSYVGTSVSKSILLNVGIVDDSHWISDTDLTDYDLSRESVDGHSIVFTHSTNGLDHHAIQNYLFWSSYASSMLFPLSTQTRAIDDNSALKLYKSPDYGDETITEAAKLSDYVRIPFAFQAEIRSGSELPDRDVWLTDVSIQASGQHIDRSVRLCFEDTVANRCFIMKPSDKGTGTGYTEVAGMLDLDGDGTYDYSKLTDEEYGKEYYYGQYTGTKTHSETPYGTPLEEADYDNVNSMAAEEQVASTFYAKHSPDAKPVNFGELTPNRAYYYKFGQVKPSVNADGFYAGDTGIPITSISNTTGVGYVNLYIYIEGWDHSVVDKSAGYSFNLGLRFEVNRN